MKPIEASEWCKRTSDQMNAVLQSRAADLTVTREAMCILRDGLRDVSETLRKEDHATELLLHQLDDLRADRDAALELLERERAVVREQRGFLKLAESEKNLARQKVDDLERELVSPDYVRIRKTLVSNTLNLVDMLQDVSQRIKNIAAGDDRFMSARRV